MTEIVEGSLLFSFPDGWEAEKYDDDDGFVARNCRIDGTKRVDIVALSPDRLLLIEVKDFRKYAIENKERMDVRGGDPLHVEVAQKVRDTFAFLVAAHREQDEVLKPFYTHALGGRQKAIDVILFVEEDEERARSVRGGRLRADLEQGMKTLLKPFNVRCHVQRRRSMPANSPWSVRGAPATASGP
ncbi:NERD domain-containing protein [Azospirillum endophyticum]